MQRDHKVEEVHGVDVQLIAKAHVWFERSEVCLGSDLAQNAVAVQILQYPRPVMEIFPGPALTPRR